MLRRENRSTKMLALIVDCRDSKTLSPITVTCGFCGKFSKKRNEIEAQLNIKRSETSSNMNFRPTFFESHLMNDLETRWFQCQSFKFLEKPNFLALNDTCFQN